MPKNMRPFWLSMKNKVLLQNLIYDHVHTNVQDDSYPIVLLEHSVEELWMRDGVWDTTRYLPLHILHSLLGTQMCAAVHAIHSLTGCDITSKVCTRKAALKADPVRYLQHFGTSRALQDIVVHNAETFIVSQTKNKSQHNDRASCRTISSL